MVENRKEKRNGIWVPEDRLRVILIGGLFVPLSVGLSGLVTTYIAGPLGLVLNLLCLFMNGVGVSQYTDKGYSPSRFTFYTGRLRSHSDRFVQRRRGTITKRRSNCRSYVSSIQS